MSTMRTIFLLLISASLWAQELPFEGFVPASPPTEGLRACFYNVENLFDTQDDSLTLDEEFTPESDKNWTPSRYWDKQRNLAKTLLAVGYEQAPAIIGLCEVENRGVLEDLVQQDIMQVHNYRIVHFESTDRRGIDVGLLLQRDQVELLSASFIRLNREDEPDWKTRDILYAKVRTIHWSDTLHLFVNHWPSRRGGEEASRPLRMLAAQALKLRVDSVLALRPQQGIIIMGDLNDGVGDASLVQGLKAASTVSDTAVLVDGMAGLPQDWGTHKYRGEWAYLDHFVLSSNLLKGEGRSRAGQVEIFKAHFLLQPDDRYTGFYPLRTYSGPRYLGGFSDHLPIYLDLFPVAAGTR